MYRYDGNTSSLSDEGGAAAEGLTPTVGAATTSAVVTSIVFIVVACAILTVVYDALEI